MAASQRVQVLTENLKGIELLAEFLANPKLIDNLSKEVIALNKLQEDEEAKLIEARNIIRNRDDVADELTQLRVVLAEEKISHDAQLANERSATDKYKAEAIAEISAADAALAERLAAADDLETRLNQRESALKEKAALMKGLFKE